MNKSEASKEAKKIYEKWRRDKDEIKGKLKKMEYGRRQNLSIRRRTKVSSNCREASGRKRYTDVIIKLEVTG